MINPTMKLFFVSLFFIPLVAQAQISSGSTLDIITKAIGSGDVPTLSSHFDQNLDISILDKEKSYSKAQAVDAIQAFFNNNKPKSFNSVHSGTSRGSTDQYCIGNLSSSGGNFRVYIYLKANSGTMVVKELRFDKE
jgi:hypothetical protein